MRLHQLIILVVLAREHQRLHLEFSSYTKVEICVIFKDHFSVVFYLKNVIILGNNSLARTMVRYLHVPNESINQTFEVLAQLFGRQIVFVWV